MVNGANSMKKPAEIKRMLKKMMDDRTKNKNNKDDQHTSY
jgi:hypothetical protein